MNMSQNLVEDGAVVSKPKAERANGPIIIKMQQSSERTPMENMTTMARGVGRTNAGRGALEKRPGLGRPGRQARDGGIVL